MLDKLFVPKTRLDCTSKIVVRTLVMSAFCFASLYLSIRFLFSADIFHYFDNGSEFCINIKLFFSKESLSKNKDLNLFSACQTPTVEIHCPPWLYTT